MAAKKFIVELEAAERTRLNALISKGKAPAKVILKARILLKADQAEGGPGWLDAEIVEAFDTNLTMVSRVRETFVTEGLDAVLTRKKRETPPIPAIPAPRPPPARGQAARGQAMAESELAVLSGQCLARRIADAVTLKTEAAAWRTRRNIHNAKANWHFTTAEARVKLKSLYPAL